MYTKILGYKIFNGSRNELLKEIKGREKVNIISGNPEVLFTGLENNILRESFLSDNALIIPDGIGTLLAAKMVKSPVKEKIAGIELMEEIIKLSIEEKKGIYLLGAKEEVVTACGEKLKEKYPEISILGAHNGFFDIDNCYDILNDIKEKTPYALFIAMGCPRQEIFIEKYMKELPCKIYMGVGGSFDVFAGNVMRAPRWMISIGLEWLYRVVKEPWRVKRLIVIPKFLIKVIGE